MDKEYTKILREIPYKLSDVIEKKGHYEPQQILEALKYLKGIATDEESFKREFYNEVNKYYGTNFDVKQTEILLKKVRLCTFLTITRINRPTLYLYRIG